MKGLTIVGGALGTLLLLAGAAHAQAPNPPVSPSPTTTGPRFVDANGDGVCDNCTGPSQGQGQKMRRGRGGAGAGDGTGNQGVGPRDGSGQGRGRGRATCNGTGRGPRG